MNLKSPAMLYREAVDLLVNKQNALFQVVDNHIVEWYETELEQPSQEEILLKYEELKLADNSTIIYCKNFLTIEQSTVIFKELKLLNFEQYDLTIFGN